MGNRSWEWGEVIGDKCAVTCELYTIWVTSLLADCGWGGCLCCSSTCNCTEEFMLLSIAVVSVAVWAAVGAFVALLVWS